MITFPDGLRCEPGRDEVECLIRRGWHEYVINHPDATDREKAQALRDMREKELREEEEREEYYRQLGEEQGW